MSNIGETRGHEKNRTRIIRFLNNIIYLNMNKFESINTTHSIDNQSVANDNNLETYTPSYVCEIDTPFQVDLVSIDIGN
jgi:hypothetical protein